VVDESQLLIMLAIGLPFIGTGLILVLGRSNGAARDWLAVALAAVTAGATLWLMYIVWLAEPVAILESFHWAPSIGLDFTVYLDPLAVMMAVVAGCIGALVVLYSTKYMEGSEGLSRYYALVLLFIGAMIGLVFTDNLLVLYFFWEIVGLCSYALIGFNTKDPKAARAGIKAFVTTRVGDVAFLIGIFVLYAAA